MADQVAFYRKQAEMCGNSAASSNLKNERQKFLDAQSAWQTLADGMAKTQAAAAKREAERRNAPDTPSQRQND